MKTQREVKGQTVNKHIRNVHTNYFFSLGKKHIVYIININAIID